MPNAEAIGLAVDDALMRHPRWCEAEAQERELRKDLYSALIAADAMEHVGLVDHVPTILRKAAV